MKKLNCVQIAKLAGLVEWEIEQLTKLCADKNFPEKTIEIFKDDIKVYTETLLILKEM